LYRVRDGRAVEHNGRPIQFNAANQDDAESKIDRYVADFNLPSESYSVRPVTNVSQTQQFQEPSDTRGDLTPRGPGPWEIYRLSDNSSVRELSNTDRTAAGEEARQALGLRGEAPELYGVRTRQPAQSTQPQQQTFTGYWDVLAGDEVVFRVQAETQGEANQKAREWMLGRSREFLQQYEGQEISTRPRYA
jgi:hypothetical protein